MLKIFALAFVVSVVAGKGYVEHKQCHYILKHSGRIADCPKGYVATALCTSGRRSDCSGHTTGLQCCKVKSSTHQELKCTGKSGRYGRWVSCPANKAVTSVCTSKAGAACDFAYTRFSCCQGLGIGVSEKCHWILAKYGKIARCPHHHVIGGVCSSGRGGDCGRRKWTGIRCCPLGASRAVKGEIDQSFQKDYNESFSSEQGENLSGIQEPSKEFEESPTNGINDDYESISREEDVVDENDVDTNEADENEVDEDEVDEDEVGE